MYVSSTSSYIMVLKNKIFDHSFSTLCTQIKTFAIDKNEIFAVNCYAGVIANSNNIIYLYNSNGTYTGQSWRNPVIYSKSISFDGIGNLVISNYYGLYIFNQLPMIKTLPYT